MAVNVNRQIFLAEDLLEVRKDDEKNPDETSLKSSESSSKMETCNDDYKINDFEDLNIRDDEVKYLLIQENNENFLMKPEKLTEVETNYHRPINLIEDVKVREKEKNNDDRTNIESSELSSEGTEAVAENLDKLLSTSEPAINDLSDIKDTVGLNRQNTYTPVVESNCDLKKSLSSNVIKIHIENNYGNFIYFNKIKKIEVDEPDELAYDYTRDGFNLLHAIAQDHDIKRYANKIFVRFDYIESANDIYQEIYECLKKYCINNKMTRFQLLSELSVMEFDVSHLCKLSQN